MAYLIDGNNFLGVTEPLLFRDPQTRYGLARKLLIFQRVTRSRVVLVFDGRPDPYLSDERLQSKKFSVVFPPEGVTADALIQELMAGLRDLRGFFLVTSDRELRTIARSRGAGVIGCREFDQRLKQALTEHKTAKEFSKSVERPSPLEIGLWTDIFSSKK